jgi:hypothetical protein
MFDKVCRRQSTAFTVSDWWLNSSLSEIADHELLIYFVGEPKDSVITKAQTNVGIDGTKRRTMMKLTAAVVTAKVWPGWRRFVAVLVALYFPLQIPLQATLFLGSGRGPNPFLLGGWGVCWMMLGFAIWSSIGDLPENRRIIGSDLQTNMC